MYSSFRRMITQLAILALFSFGHCAKRNDRINDEPESDPTACSPLGKYQGSIMKNSFDKPIYAFRGIRYAEPPKGELRFKPAVPVKKHEGVFDATSDPPACPQSPLGQDPMSEDCLFLNVYTTKLPTENDKVKRPVLVFIHGGDFQKFSSRSNWAGPEYLMNKNIILVTFNYRLGVLGFISTGDKEAPGNLGMKDQVEVLKWIKQNIEGFGGDPNNVTIYGVGSGGACVNLHLVSPLTKGLFHKAILSGGTITGVYPIGKSLLRLTKRQAKVVGCPENSTSGIVECLKRKPAFKLGKSISQLNPFPEGFSVWKPVIEEDFGQERFLTDHPVKLMLEGKFHKVPINIGFNSGQFTDLAIELVQDSEELKKFDREFDEVAPKVFSYDQDKLRAKSISEQLRKFYFGDEKIQNSTLPQLMDLYNDGLVGNEIHRAIKLIAQRSKEPIYEYYFSHLGKFSHFHPKEGPAPKGPVLYDDLIYIFYISTMFPKIEKNDPEFPLVELITSKIAQFVSTGNPNRPEDKVQWEPYDLSSEKYLESSAMKKKLHEKRFAEWEKLFPLTKYYVVQDFYPHVEMCN